MRKILFTLAAFFGAVLICFASSGAQMGTWKLNEAKSKMPPSIGKNTITTLAASGDEVKVTVDGVDDEGKPTHNEWIGKIDGKDYAVTGDPTSDMRSYKQIDDHNWEVTVKKGGKTTMTGKILISADGKTRTLTFGGTDANGKKFTATAVYDKQ